MSTERRSIGARKPFTGPRTGSEPAYDEPSGPPSTSDNGAGHADRFIPSGEMDFIARQIESVWQRYSRFASSYTSAQRSAQIEEFLANSDTCQRKPGLLAAGESARNDLQQAKENARDAQKNCASAKATLRSRAQRAADMHLNRHLEELRRTAAAECAAARTQKEELDRALSALEVRHRHIDAAMKQLHAEEQAMRACGITETSLKVKRVRQQFNGLRKELDGLRSRYISLAQEKLEQEVEAKRTAPPPVTASQGQMLRAAFYAEEYNKQLPLLSPLDRALVKARSQVDVRLKRLKRIEKALWQLDDLAQHRLWTRCADVVYAHSAAASVPHAELRRGAAPPEQGMLDHLRCFDLVLFDLDETLVASRRLERFRGEANLNNTSEGYAAALARACAGVQLLIQPEILSHLRASFPTMKFGVFTRSPRAYAKMLLRVFYPELSWDVVVAFEDVRSTKPNPEGVAIAADAAGCKDIQRIAVVGDDLNDVLAGYNAGAFAVLTTHGWGDNWHRLPSKERNAHHRVLDTLPDAVIDSPEQLPSLVAAPWRYLPALEAWYACVARGEAPPRTLRQDTVKRFQPREEGDERFRWVEVRTLGRYFRSNSTVRRIHHEISQSVIAAKEGAHYPQSWVDCCAAVVRNYAERAHWLRMTGDLLVTVIPAREGRPRRLEALLSRLEKLLAGSSIAFDAAIFAFRQEAVSHSRGKLNAIERFRNAERHLFVAQPAKVRGRLVLVIDDVVTSGATLFWADSRLRQAGAEPIALALCKTVP